MKKMILVFSLFLAGSGSLYAKPKVIDVGDLEVKGEVRKPFIQLLDSEQSAKALLPRLSKDELRDLEETLLKTGDAPTNERSRTTEKSHGHS